MNQSNNVVVGVDGSEASWAALDWALGYARERNATVVIRAAVITRSGEEMVGGIMDERVKRTDEVVQEALTKAAAAGVDAQGALSMVPAARALLETSEGARALVVGATGYGAVSAAVWGSVSRNVTRHAEIPTVVVRPPKDPESTTVVVGIDGTILSEEALAFAFDVASFREWDLLVLHAADAPGSWKSWNETVNREEGEHRDAVRRVVAETMAGWREKYPDVAVETDILQLDPVEALKDASARAALVVVGAHGRRPVKGYLGSVSQAVVRQSHCPVVVLH